MVISSPPPAKGTATVGEVEVKEEPVSPSASPKALQQESFKRKGSYPSEEDHRHRHQNRRNKRQKNRSHDEEEDRHRRRRRHDPSRSRSKSQEGENRRKRRRKATDAPERQKQSKEGVEEQTDAKEAAEWFTRKRKEVDPLTTKTGGAYIPPAKLRLMQQQIADKGSEKYQRLEWERLKKRIHGQVNKINVGNLVSIVRDLLQENIVRGKGLLARSIIQAQAFSPSFSHVYAALVAVINSKFPHIGELVLRRLIIQFKRSFRRNDKQTTVTVTKFLAHLINQQVAHEVLALEILTLLLETPTDDSVEVAVAFLRESGAKLTEVTPRGINAIFDRLRSILQESKDVDKRVQYMIEVIFSVRKDKYKAHPAVVEELDLVEEDDQITHTITLDDAQDPENTLNVFRLDPDFEKSEEMYEEIKKEILGEDSDADEEDEDEEGSDEEGNDKKTMILDNTEANLVAFRRLVYLTIQSSLDYQEAAHKLMKLEMKPGMEVELCNMILDCCAQQRTYEKFYGLLAERFCRLRKEFQENFQQILKDTYETIHRFEITKLRNTTKLFAHLLFTDAISWEVLAIIRLNEDDSTSAGRIFIKVLFQELSEYMGLDKLFERITDASLQAAFEGLFPRDNPRDTRFSINFFTSIGLGGLTVHLREHLQSGPKQMVSLPGMADTSTVEENSSSSGSSSDTDSSSSSSSEEDSTPERKPEPRKPMKPRRSREQEGRNRRDEERKNDSGNRERRRDSGQERSRDRDGRGYRKEDRHREDRRGEETVGRDPETDRGYKKEDRHREDLRQRTDDRHHSHRNRK